MALQLSTRAFLRMSEQRLLPKHVAGRHCATFMQRVDGEHRAAEITDNKDCLLSPRCTASNVVLSLTQTQYWEVRQHYKWRFGKCEQLCSAVDTARYIAANCSAKSKTHGSKP